MKQLNITRILLALLFSMAGITASAHNYEVTNEDGKPIYLQWWDNQHTQLYVTYRGDACNSYSNEYSGNVVIPDSATIMRIVYPVMGIGSKAFWYCEGLTSVTIPNSVIFIGTEAFEGCSNLKSLIIPNSVTDIHIGAFLGCSSLTNIDIPNSVTKIENCAFQDCTGLTNVNISNSLTSIEYRLFFGCSNLKSVTIPNSVKVIGNEAFYGCSSINTINIGSSVTSIGERAFGTISNLTDVYCYAENVPTTYSNTFDYSNIENVVLHVPAESLDLYKQIGFWKNFKEIVAIEPPQKCATPTIAFAKNKMTFNCETEDVEFHYSLSLVGTTSGIGSEASGPLSYRISVYAAKEGFANSDVAIMDIDFSTLKGDANDDGEITIADAVEIVNTILGNNDAGD